MVGEFTLNLRKFVLAFVDLAPQLPELLRMRVHVSANSFFTFIKLGLKL